MAGKKLYCNTLQCRRIVLQECAVAEICIAIAGGLAGVVLQYTSVL